MQRHYKIDIFEKCIEFVSLIYFVFGFFTTYAWACKELDKVSQNIDINNFWQPIAAVYGLMNIANIAGIVLCVLMNRKHDNGEHPLVNRENNLLFHILCTPLFFVTVVYLCWELANDGLNIYVTGPCSFFMTLCEMLLFIGAMSLILNINKTRLNLLNRLHCQLNSLVLLTTLIGVLNYFLFHMTGQQIVNFVKTAANFSAYQKYYTTANIYRQQNDSIHFRVVQNYIQPLVILFSCCCLAYLVTLLYRINSTGKEKQLIQDDKDDSAPVSELTSRTHSEDNLLLPLDNVANTPPFRLPPLSLLLGILFITITILILVIVVSLTAPDTVENLRRSGQLTFTLFPVLVYLVSIGLLCVQINDMQRWPKLTKNKNIVDKALVWIGAAGQLIVSFAQIKLITDQSLFNYETTESSLFASIIVVYVLLIFQTLFQSLTICLALDREWLPPAIQTWQEFICPPVGMLSINIGLFLFSVYAVKNDSAMANFTIGSDTKLFLKIFGSGFNSIGETLAILSRLHSSLIFGKMIAFTNKRK